MTLGRASNVVFMLLAVLAAVLDSPAANPDVDTLLRIKSYIIDPLNKLESWKIESSQASSAPCSWLGVTCDPRMKLPLDRNSTSSHSSSSLIISIDLSSSNLSGTISPEIGSLVSLQSLNLAHNNFTGPIPAAISRCSSLKLLNLSDNALSDAIPAVLFTELGQLETVDLWINSLTGTIPPEVGYSPRLEHLDLGGNYIEGVIPVELFNLSTLRYLTLAGNSLVGPIPEKISNLQRLEWIYLGYNQLNGSIPAGIGSIGSSLLHLDLVFNDLTGPIPGDAIANLSRLEYLFLYTNRLSGEIPASIGRLRRLISLDLSNNSFTGEIPSSLGEMPSLEIVNLFQNNLSGPVPVSFSSMPRLKTLALWKNNLSGTIDPGLGLASNLTAVDLSTNALSGSIPPGLCSNGALFKLILFDNAFDGHIPDDIAACSSLKRVRIQNNRLTGSFPGSLAAMDQLYFLDISGNRLSGSISGTNWTSPSLQILSLEDNAIVGEIPASVFQLPALVELQLGKNKFSGPIPDTIGHASLLTELDLSRNQLSDAIPAQIGQCSKLVSLDLSDNHLTGSIPEAIGELSTLGFLDISQNYLTGGIPPSLASIQSLEFLNVSGNRLTGPFPSTGALAAIANASTVAGNELCGDGSEVTRKLSLPTCRDPEGVTYALSWVLGVGLCLCVAAVLAYLVLLFVNRRRRQHVRPHVEEDINTWHLVIFHKLRLNGEEIVSSSRSSSASVFEARDQGGSVFSVKRFSRSSVRGSESALMQRMEAVSRIRHENVAKVMGICTGKDVVMLLFQHLPQGSLSSVLFPVEKPDAGAALEWNQRYEICVGTAKALAFLHSSRVLHGSFSPHTVFLDANFRPKVVVEFAAGEAKAEASKENHCYTAPELMETKIITEKSDVYAFGLTVLELLTGKPASKSSGGSIVEWIQHCIADKGWQAGNQFLDVSMAGVSPQMDAEMMRVVKIALCCTKLSPVDRPDMTRVVKLLEHARQSLPKSMQMIEII